jgi:biopolymer transport protein ExbD
MVRKRSRSAPLICEIDFTGFSVVMVIVVFVPLTFMMSIPPPHGGVSINLPKADHSVAMRRASRDNAMVITITQDGKVYLRSDPVGIEQLPTLIHERLTSGAERKVYLKVDRNAKYGVVLSVLAEVRSAGVERVGFLVARRPPPQTFSP